MIFLSGFTYKKDNGYLSGIIGVSGVVHPQTQLNDALIESYQAVKGNLTTRWKAIDVAGDLA